MGWTLVRECVAIVESHDGGVPRLLQERRRALAQGRRVRASSLPAVGLRLEAAMHAVSCGWGTMRPAPEGGYSLGESGDGVS